MKANSILAAFLIAAAAGAAGAADFSDLQRLNVSGVKAAGVVIPLTAPETVSTSKPDALSALRKHGCLACHKYKGEGGSAGPALDSKLKRHSKDWLKAKLLVPPSPAMPSFAGTTAELEEFISAVLQ